MSRVSSVAFLAALSLAIPVAASAAAPHVGTYKATTKQCGTSVAPHPCSTFRFKLAKTRCASPTGHIVKRGYCVTFLDESPFTVTSLDVTCPDGTTFASQLIGPLTKVLLSPSATLHFSAHSSVEEEGKEIVEGREALTLIMKGTHASGTLSIDSQQHIGAEPPECKSGAVAFTAKLV
ncbi:MAG TPA: hypothetical protein VGG08_02195 [Solirubrobacteraceae bacterium]|jgi:hypothetical protein